MFSRGNIAEVAGQPRRRSLASFRAGCGSAYLVYNVFFRVTHEEIAQKTSTVLALLCQTACRCQTKRSAVNGNDWPDQACSRWLWVVCATLLNYSVFFSFLFFFALFPYLRYRTKTHGLGIQRMFIPDHHNSRTSRAVSTTSCPTITTFVEM